MHAVEWVGGWVERRRTKMSIEGKGDLGTEASRKAKGVPGGELPSFPQVDLP